MLHRRTDGGESPYNKQDSRDIPSADGDPDARIEERIDDGFAPYDIEDELAQYQAEERSAQYDDDDEPAQYETEYEPFPAYDPEDDGSAASAPPRRRRRPFRRLLLVIVVLVLLFGAAFVAVPQQPVRETEGLGARHLATSTILLAGTDAGGSRTDTILLLSIDMLQHRVALTSIPRDTYVHAGYAVPKINSAVPAGGGGAAVMEELIEQVTHTIGFSPDGYLLVDLAVFEQLVDRMGGVWFLVPQDMYYVDPTQDLHIELNAGYQKLDGEKALQLLRFRSGYAAADLERVAVQRDFLQAATEQWLRPLRLLRLPTLLPLLREQTTTDLSVRNLIWIAEGLLLCQERTEGTLPGTPQMIAGGSYYVPESPDRIRAGLLGPYS